MIYNIHTINIDLAFQKLCRNPYPNHPMGVNVTDLMKDNAGIELEWPPKITTYQVALAGLRI